MLLQKRADKGTWGLPGGALELGESALEALVREFYEETGVEVRVEKLLNVYTKYSDSYPNGDEAQVLTILYLVSSETSISINFFTSDETLELGFFDHSDIQNIAIVNQQHQDMINDFFENKFPIDR
ncbi:NUDIX domain-containing protein [uncultured Streptococcus sp.]|uniref:NUDIX domain-containing protein n=1 Tax=uncultured Streptococcus sp. TaxID=83427 RepID=UPI0037DCA739